MEPGVIADQKHWETLSTELTPLICWDGICEEGTVEDLVSLCVWGPTPQRESTKPKSVWSQTKARFDWFVGMKSMLFQEIELFPMSDSNSTKYYFWSDTIRLSPLLFNLCQQLIIYHFLYCIIVGKDQ